MDIKQQLQFSLLSVLKELGIAVESIELTHPQNASQGDLSTNVAMVAAKQAGKNPRELAELIVANGKWHHKGVLQMANGNFIKKVEVAGPGFINFYFSEQYFLGELKKLLTEGNERELSGSLSGKKVMVEFTDPNPFKEFHIGHLYSNTVGEAISRLIESQGAEVKRANYQGDVGLHVAKAIWGMRQLLMANSEWHMEEIEEKSVGERARWLGEAYALGAKAYEDDEEAKQEIIAINKDVYMVILNEREGSRSNEDIHALYTKGRQWSLDYFETMYARLGTKFTYYFFESDAGPIGLELVREFLGKDLHDGSHGVFKESDGAVVFPGEEHGLHTRVFINSLGLPTYEAKELGLARTKYATYPFDLSISITGNEINEYFKVLLKVLSLVSPEIAEKTRHISHGMVRLPEGKMSSRTGNVITGEWLLDEAKSRLRNAYPEMADETVEQVAVGAIKWALLRVGIGKDISFNMDESISFEGDSGPYIQYTYVRTQSVLHKSEIRNSKFEREGSSFWEATTTPESLSGEELHLVKLLVRFSEVSQEAAEKYAPNLLTNYLFDVAQAFNAFYQKVPILSSLTTSDTGDVKVSFPLLLNIATGKILNQGLHLLGIQAPEKM